MSEIELRPKRRLLLVDGNNIAWRWVMKMAHTGQQLATTTGIVTTVSYGIVESIIKANETLALMVSHNLQRSVKTYYDDVIVCWDHRGPVWRHELCSVYKANRNDEKRKQIKAEVLPYIESAQHFLKAIGVRQISVKHLEGDDIIGVIANAYKELDYTVSIVSGDHDLWQLLDWGKVWQHDGRDIMWDASWFYEQYKIHPKRWSEVKAIDGDDGDNVIGVDGFGEKLSVAVIQNVDHITSLNVEKLPKIKFLKDKKKNALADAIANGVVYLNYQLVNLPKSITELSSEIQNDFAEEWKKLSTCGSTDAGKAMYVMQIYEMKKFMENINHVLRCLGLNNA